MNLPPGPPTAWTTATTEAVKTGTWRAALPVYGNPPSPCRVACPVNGRIAEWMQLASVGSWRAAWETLTDHNPFPAVAGRVCHHPCEASCNRAAFDEPLAICALERAIGDRAIEEGWRFPAAPPEHRKIAVVGGGPSGLSAAYHLRRRGYAVTVFEARPHLGGLLRDGIPRYRLPRAVLDREIERILELGLDVRSGIALDSAEALARLRENFDAVYLALGARRQKRLPQLDYAKPWVMDSAAYLEQSNCGVAPALGERVVVIGGGSAAIDVARSARRAGHEVTLLSLESEAQMPAQRDEVVEAKEEGVALLHGAMLRSASAGAAGDVRLECVRVNFEAGARRGEFRAVPIEGSDFAVAADAVVVAIGQDPELTPLGAVLGLDGALLHVDARGATSLPGVFAGGDVASTERFVTQAIGMGRNAAREIDRWLRGEEAAYPQAAPAVPASAINTFYHRRAARASRRRLAVQERLQGYAEVQAGLAHGQLAREAERCFSCGQCTHCDNCLRYCPDMAVGRANGGYAIAEDYCKGCGLCVQECPTGAIAMHEEWR